MEEFRHKTEKKEQGAGGIVNEGVNKDLLPELGPKGSTKVSWNNFTEEFNYPLT